MLNVMIFGRDFQVKRLYKDALHDDTTGLKLDKEEANEDRLWIIEIYYLEYTDSKT